MKIIVFHCFDAISICHRLTLMVFVGICVDWLQLCQIWTHVRSSTDSPCEFFNSLKSILFSCSISLLFHRHYHFICDLVHIIELIYGVAYCSAPMEMWLRFIILSMNCFLRLQEDYTVILLSIWCFDWHFLKQLTLFCPLDFVWILELCTQHI